MKYVTEADLNLKSKIDQMKKQRDGSIHMKNLYCTEVFTFNKPH